MENIIEQLNFWADFKSKNRLTETEKYTIHKLLKEYEKGLDEYARSPKSFTREEYDNNADE